MKNGSLNIIIWPDWILIEHLHTAFTFQVMFGVPFGPEIDIWSLGCVLAELLLGKPLFFGTSKEEIMEKVY